MQRRSGKSGKGRGRGRKSTNWPVAGAGRKSTSSIDNAVFQAITVKRSGGSPSGKFNLTLGAQTTVDIDWDADAGDVQDALEDLTNVTDVDRTGAAKLGKKKPVLIEFIEVTPSPIPELVLSDGTPPLSDVEASIEVKFLQGEFKWIWSGDDFWQDASSNRKIMDVAGDMSFEVKSNGAWTLSYIPKVLAHLHKWVYKLDAYSQEKKRLARLVMPAISRAPEYFEDVVPGGNPPLIQEGRITSIVPIFADIDFWVRVGVGEYFD